MCIPETLALASLGINAGSAAASHIGANETARTTNLGNRLNRQAAILEFGRTDAALGQREIQEQDAASARKADVGLQTQAALATNAVAAGEAGVSGHTVESLMRDIYAQEGRYDARTDQNTDWSMAQLQAQKTGASYATKDRIASMRDVTPPSFVDTGLRIGSAAVNAGTLYRNLSEPSSRTRNGS